MIDVEKRPTAELKPQPAREAPILPPPLPPRRQRSRRRWAVLVALAVLVAGAAVVATRPRTDPQSAAPPAETTATPRLIARGQVRPIQHARVGSLVGGVVSQISVAVGDAVSDGQEIARVRGPNGTIEVLVAPWRGTITGMPVRLGDTVTAGTVVAFVGDLSRLQVETTDVDEFLISHIQRGQPVVATVDALDGREILGYVRTVSLELQTDEEGDEHYPVTIDLVAPPQDLRPGMTVRIDFAPVRGGG